MLNQTLVFVIASYERLDFSISMPVSQNETLTYCLLVGEFPKHEANSAGFLHDLKNTIYYRCSVINSSQLLPTSPRVYPDVLQKDSLQ